MGFNVWAVLDPANASGNSTGEGPLSDTSNDNNPLNAASHLYDSVFGGGGSDDNADELIKKKYQRERAAIISDAFGDRTIDSISMDEIKALNTAGADNAQIKGLVSAARAGKGIYGVRKVDQAQRAAIADMPGRRQLSPTYGK